MQTKYVLPIIVFSQFCCTSLWFAGNAVMSDLSQTYDLSPTSLGHLTSAVQFGFITGTLIFAFLSIADRFSPSKVFFVCAILGALFNFGIIGLENNLQSLLLLRFATGFFLAGIYPVGMKIASDYFEKGLGTSLGFLVGALVLGTAFPHFLNSFFQTENFPWRNVILFTSALAVIGGFLVFFVPDGPFRSPMLKKKFSAFLDVFRNADFRSAAFGYFGHMWELYAFWAFVPVVLMAYEETHSNLNVSLISFLVIGSGGIACMVAGFVSEKIGTKKTASIALFLSGICCLLSPIVFFQDSQVLLISFLIFWGLMVVADSPLFSTLVARNAPPESRGTALTIVNSIGFAITIVSIQLVNLLILEIDPFYVLVILAAGPLLGLIALFRTRFSRRSASP